MLKLKMSVGLESCSLSKTHSLVTTETGNPIISNKRILLQRLSDGQLEYVLLTEDVMNSFNLILENPYDDTENNHCVSEENNENKNVSEIVKWTQEQTLLLIRLVESNYDKFNEGLKKLVWMKISQELTSMTNKKFSPEQCDTKWKGLKRTYKSIKDHNSQSGNNRKKWEFFSAIDSFLSKKPEISPPSTCSTMCNELEIKGSETEASTSSNITPSRKRKADGGVEKRHKEKLQQFNKFLKLFKVAVEHQTGKTVSDDSD